MQKGHSSQGKSAPAGLTAGADTAVDGEQNYRNKYTASAAQAQEGQPDRIDSVDGSTGEAKHSKKSLTKLRFAFTVTSRMMARRNVPPTTERCYMKVVS